MTTPTTLPALDPTLAWPSQGKEFRWRYSSTGYEHYDVWETTANPPGWWAAQGLQGIKVDTATDVWSDDGPNDPQNLSESGGVVTVLGGYQGSSNIYTFTKPTNASWHSSGGGSGGGGGFLSSNPKIENLTFTKTSDSAVDFSFDWENLGSYTVTNSRAGVVQTTTGNLSGSSGTESASFSLTCQEGDLVWIHGNYNNNALEYHPDIPGSQSNPYVFRVVNFSVSGTTLTATTFFSGSTGLNNDADFRVWDPDDQSWSRLDYINYDGTLQTKIVSPFERGKAYYVVDRSTGNDYGIRYTAPGGTRRSRGRNFW